MNVGFKALEIKNKGCNLRYWFKKGNGNVYVFLLHGAGCDHNMFEHMINIFDEKYNLIMWDARGHGMSKLDLEKHFYFYDMMEDLLILYKKHNISKAILIGQSMGGNLAQEIAYKYPEIVSCMVLIDTTNNTAPLTNLEKFMLFFSKFIFKIYPWNLLINQSADACGNTKYVKKYVKECFSKMEKQVFIEIMMSLITCLHEDKNYKFKNPVLVICGEDDKTGNIKKNAKLWVKDPAVILHIIENAGHNANQDNPDAVNKVICEFLKNDDIM